MGRTKKANPQVYTLRITSKALQSIREIAGYIIYVKHQPVSAYNVVEAIHKVIRRIVSNPHAFKECEEIPTVSRIYRRATCYSWSIIYKIAMTEVIVLGVIHQSTKPSRIRSLRRIK